MALKKKKWGQSSLRVRSAGAKMSTLFLWWNSWEGTRRTGCTWVKGESNRALEPGKHTVAASTRPLQSLQHCDKGFPPSSPKPAKPFLQSQTKQWSGWSLAHKAGVLSCLQSRPKYCQPHYQDTAPEKDWRHHHHTHFYHNVSFSSSLQNTALTSQSHWANVWAMLTWGCL